MALMSDPQRAALVARMAKKISTLQQDWPLNKVDTRTIVNETDIWIEGHKSGVLNDGIGFANALTPALQIQLNATNQAFAFTVVVDEKFDLGIF